MFCPRESAQMSSASVLGSRCSAAKITSKYTIRSDELRWSDEQGPKQVANGLCWWTWEVEKEYVVTVLFTWCPFVRDVVIWLWLGTSCTCKFKLQARHGSRKPLYASSDVDGGKINWWTVNRLRHLCSLSWNNGTGVSYLSVSWEKEFIKKKKRKVWAKTSSSWNKPSHIHTHHSHHHHFHRLLIYDMDLEPASFCVFSCVLPCRALLTVWLACWLCISSVGLLARLSAPSWNPSPWILVAAARMVIGRKVTGGSGGTPPATTDLLGGGGLHVDSTVTYLSTLS